MVLRNTTKILTRLIKLERQISELEHIILVKNLDIDLHSTLQDAFDQKSKKL